MRKADCAKDAADESAELISVSLYFPSGVNTENGCTVIIIPAERFVIELQVENPRFLRAVQAVSGGMPAQFLLKPC